MTQPPETGEEVARRIEEFIQAFQAERWAQPHRKIDVLLGLRLAQRIARGEIPSPEEGERT